MTWLEDPGTKVDRRLSSLMSQLVGLWTSPVSEDPELQLRVRIDLTREYVDEAVQIVEESKK